MNCDDAGRLLSPYIDGELDLVTTVSVEDHVAGCERCTRGYQNLQELRRIIAESDLEFAPSRELVRRVDAARRRAAAASLPWWRRPALLTAAAAALILFLFFPARLLRNVDADREIFDNHLRSLMASHLADVPSSDRHTVKPWFQGRLSFAPNVPDLSDEGFTLVGGRLEIIAGAPAAALVYRRRDHVINLFVASTSERDSPPQARTSEGYNMAAWTRSGMRYWAVSDLNTTELMQFAQLVRSR